MGQYNPHRPSILGQEWAPVRESPYLMDTETERGVTFVLDHSATVVSGAVYLADVPPGISTKGVMMAVYEAGTEHLTGPIQRVVVPPASGFWRSTDGANPSVIDTDPNGITIAQALRNPNDYSYLNIREDTNLFIQFDTSTVSAQLSGKRILGINLLYVMAGTQSGIPGPIPDTPISHDIYLHRGNPDTADQLFFGQGEPNIAVSLTTVPEINRIRMGNSMIFDMTQVCAAGVSGPGASFWPLRPADLNRFDTGTAVTQRLTVEFVQQDGCSGCASLNLPRNNYSYMALEILYCEETRLLYGGRGWYACDPHLLNVGQNKVMLKPSDTFGLAGRTLTPGEYTVTVTMADMGEVANGVGGNYSATALLQDYALPTHTGVVIDTRAIEGRTFQRSTSDILPRITLHTASGVVTGVHDYDTLASAPVYNAANVVADVVLRSGGASVSYPQVRFYARRVGDTNTALILRRQSIPANQVSISAEDFDALPEIVDGWREVTLRFPSGNTPTMSDSGVAQNWEWVSNGLDINNQWEILLPYGESASSGVFDTSQATYGGSAALTEVGADTLNADADATLIFSQDPPAVTGFAVEVVEQDLVAVSDECALDPACIPTALYYNQLTWPARDVADDFEDRTGTNGWGETPDGQLWSSTGGTIDDYFVVTGAAHMRIDAVNTLYASTIEANAYNVEVHGVVRVPVLPSGAGVTPRVVARQEDASNNYEAQISISTAGVVQLYLVKRVSGVGSIISGFTTIDGVHAAGDIWHIVLRTQGDTLLAQAWKDGYPRPLNWQSVAHTLPGDSITGTQAGASFRAETGFSGGTIDVEWLEFSATNLDITAFQIQRRDDVDDEWQTVMLSTGTAVSQFNDYEARVGVQSQYRIRTVNALNFYGPWTLSDVLDRYTWNASVEGWVGEGATTVTWDPVIKRDGAGSLRATETMGPAFAELRFNDAQGGSTRDISSFGETLTVWVLVPADARGSGWQARLEVQDPGFTWQPGPDIPLIKGIWTPVQYTVPLSLRQSCRSIGMAVGATGVNAVQSINVDTLRQGTGLSTVTPPGVVGAGIDGNSIMLFTTNEVQDGASNLAYVMTWTNDITEEFSFPEAGTVQLRDLFRRDFPLAFRPLERGGERFSRDLIVQNAAVPAVRLRDGFRSLRDMAWEDVPYICVRNELGDRWLSTVLVPNGKVQRNRRLYIARVEIIEVTDTPSPVDPTEA